MRQWWTYFGLDWCCGKIPAWWFPLRDVYYTNEKTGHTNFWSLILADKYGTHSGARLKPGVWNLEWKKQQLALRYKNEVLIKEEFELGI